MQSYFGQNEDTELLQLLPLLIALSKQRNVRVSLNQTYRLPEIVRKYRMDHGLAPSNLDGRLYLPRSSLRSSLMAIGSPRSHQLQGGDRLRIYTAAIGATATKFETDDEDDPGDDECMHGSGSTDEGFLGDEDEAIGEDRGLDDDDEMSSSTPLMTGDLDDSVSSGTSAEGLDCRRLTKTPIAAELDNEAIPIKKEDRLVSKDVSLERTSRSRGAERSGSRHLVALSKMLPITEHGVTIGPCLRNPVAADDDTRRMLVLPPGCPKRFKRPRLTWEGTVTRVISSPMPNLVVRTTVSPRFTILTSTTNPPPLLGW